MSTSLQMDRGRRRPTLGGIIAFMTVVVFAGLNMGSACNPIIAALDNECGCSAPQQSICGACATPANEGQSCTDECGAHPCAFGLFCTSDHVCSSNALGGLLGLGTGDAAVCNAQQEQQLQLNSCGTGFYCRSQLCLFGNAFNDGKDHCSPYALQGEACGAVDQSGLPCGQCQPGTQCINGTCAAPCTGPGSGPGPDGDCQTMCGGAFPDCLSLGTDSQGSPETEDNFDGFCYASCAARGATCTSAKPCCDLGNACGPTGTCCETPDTYPLSGTQCGGSADCCPGYVCARTTGDAPTTCQGCHGKDSYCAANSDCCSGLACNQETNECERALDGSCNTDYDCANGSCACVQDGTGVCALPLGAGQTCPSRAGTCLCQLGGGPSAQCGKNGLCCLGGCAACRLDSDCCGYSSTGGKIRCLADSGPGSIAKCCGTANAACQTTSDCCPQHDCEDGFCVTHMGQFFQTSCTEAGGCSAVGAPCNETSPCCAIPQAQCRAGSCQLVTNVSYHLVSYEFQTYSSVSTTPLFDVPITTGVPVGVSALEVPVVVTRSADQMLAYQYNFSDAGAPVVTQALQLPITQPYNVSAIVPFGHAGAPATFDALVGQPGETTYYQILSSFGSDGGLSASLFALNAATVSGNAIAVSPSSNFDVTSYRDATIGTDASQLYHFEFGSTPPTPEGHLDLTGIGVPVALDTASDDTWVAVLGSGSGNIFLHLGVPALGTIRSAPFDPALGSPIAVSGAKSWQLTSQLGFILVAFAPNGATPAQIRAYHGGNVSDSAALQVNLTGTPVAMTVTTILDSQYAWVATKAPNQVLLFDVTRSLSLLSTVALPGTPLAMAIGTPPDQGNPLGTGCSLGCGNTEGQTGLVHVVLSEP
jgi:hypothetical protein